MPSWKRRLQHATANVFSLPTDTVTDLPRVTCVGARDMVVENVVGLLHVSRTEIRLDLGTAHVHVEGSEFEVNLVAGREVHLSGRVDVIRFARVGGETQ